MINCFIHVIYWGLGIEQWWFFKDWDNRIVQWWLYNYFILPWILLFSVPLSWLCHYITCTFFPFVSQYTAIVNDVFASYDLSVVLLLSTQPIADDVLAVGLTRKAVYYLVSCNICALRCRGWLRRLWPWCPLCCIRFLASPRWSKTIPLLCIDPIAVSSMCLFWIISVWLCCYFIYLSLSICHCWWCDDDCEVLLVYLNILLCLCYFAFWLVEHMSMLMMLQTNVFSWNIRCDFF